MAWLALGYYRLGLPPIRVGPGYPAGLYGRVLPVTGSGSDPQPTGFFGPGARVPEYPGTRPGRAPGYQSTRLATCPGGQHACS